MSIDQRAQRSFESRFADFSPELSRFLRQAWNRRTAVDYIDPARGIEALYQLYSGPTGFRAFDEQELLGYVQRVMAIGAGRHTHLQGTWPWVPFDHIIDHGQWQLSRHFLWITFYWIGDPLSATKRVYIHALHAHAALTLLAACADWLDEIPGFLAIKVTGPGDMNRADTLVAYLYDDGAQAQLVERLRALVQRQAGLVGDPLPPVVRRVDRGLGVADEPPEFRVFEADDAAHSFGEAYAAIVWQALSNTPAVVLPMADGRHFLDNVLYTLRSLGVDPQRPHEFPDRERLKAFEDSLNARQVAVAAAQVQAGQPPQARVV